MARKPISKKTRFDIFKRDGFQCMYCGSSPPKVLLHVDHIVPVKEGGGNDVDNLCTACVSCNLGKAAVSLGVVPQSLKDRATETLEREAQLLGYHEVMEGRRQRLEAQAWDIVNIFMPNTESVDRNWFKSIKNFVDKLGYHEVADAIEIAISNKPHSSNKVQFHYFCGICWNWLRDGRQI